ncbi:MAG: segregation/condensation protein A [candidate division WOR-3 bacterium]|nr:segregation/condensation protein A [candidate division WOR-3 bacterium]MCX7757488.1 segregation/condensation protein A [candidate division WOR-3 bacterium]MDW7987133.1 segregation/condensation protein A [candidate division WOR-3 bacterium]
MKNNLEIQTEVFSGPIELLVYLVRKNEIDILEIPISKITNEYLQYLKTAQSLNIELGIEFLLMAVVLIRLKITSLLPSTTSQEELPESKMSLEEIIAEYRKYTQIANLLGDLEKKRAFFFPRKPNFKAEIIDEHDDIYSLILAFKNLLAKRRETPTLDIVVPEIKLEDKILELRKIFEIHHKITFSDLTRNSQSITEIILLFIALLELIRLGEIKARQETEFSEIFLEKY